MADLYLTVIPFQTRVKYQSWPFIKLVFAAHAHMYWKKIVNRNGNSQKIGVVQ